MEGRCREAGNRTGRGREESDCERGVDAGHHGKDWVGSRVSLGDWNGVFQEICEEKWFFFRADNCWSYLGVKIQRKKKNQQAGRRWRTLVSSAGARIAHLVKTWFLIDEFLHYFFRFRPCYTPFSGG